MLTSKQRELLEFIRIFQMENDISPSFEQMMVGIGLKSKSGVHRLLRALEERGAITRLQGRARAIRVNRRAAREAAIMEIEKTARLGLNGSITKTAALSLILKEACA